MFKNLMPWRHKHEKRPVRGELTTSPAATGLASLQDEFDSLLERFWRDVPSLWEDGDPWDIGWGCDLEDSEKEIVVRAEAPGFDADEIEVQMSGNRLVMQAEHKEETKERHGRTTHYGKFTRTMTLPRGIEADKIKANYKNGVLEVHLPKGPEAQAKRIPVKAK